jgi:hypothetical protein
MQQFNGISHYIGSDMDNIIVRALRLFVDQLDGTSKATKDEIDLASNYANALENDTYLLETTTPPHEWPAVPVFAETKSDAVKEWAEFLGLPIVDVPLIEERNCTECANPIDEHEPGEYDDECQYKLTEPVTGVPIPPPANDLVACDHSTWLSTIWGALHGYREDCIPEGDPMYDDQWSDITTAMAWITEALEDMATA